MKYDQMQQFAVWQSIIKESTYQDKAKPKTIQTIDTMSDFNKYRPNKGIIPKIPTSKLHVCYVDQNTCSYKMSEQRETLIFLCKNVTYSRSR